MIRIKQLREEKELSQLEFAKKLNLTQQSISLYEKGEREPSLDVIKSIAEFFDCTVDYIIGKSDVRNLTNTTNTDEEKELLKHYKKLNNLGKQTAITYVEGLTEVPKFTEKREELKNA